MPPRLGGLGRRCAYRERGGARRQRAQRGPPVDPALIACPTTSHMTTVSLIPGDAAGSQECDRTRTGRGPSFPQTRTVLVARVSDDGGDPREIRDDPAPWRTTGAISDRPLEVDRGVGIPPKEPTSRRFQPTPSSPPSFREQAVR